jgi:hypothetical protein
MKVIYKYKLNYNPIQTLTNISMVQPLSIQLQDGIPVLWCIVDEVSVEPRNYTISCIWTGEPFSDNIGWYIGTIQDALVYHYFIKADSKNES